MGEKPGSWGYNHLMIRPNTDLIPDGDFDPKLAKHIQALIDAQNDKPDPEIGGLSPNQAYSLLYTDWESENCPLKLNKNLTIEDLADSTVFHNVRVFLSILIEMRDFDTATATGNLNRKVVKAAFDRMRLSDIYKEDVRRFCKVINEPDLGPLYILRVICELTGLIRLRKKRFTVLKKHQKLLSDSEAGQLYHMLFLACFRKFNLGFYDRFPDLDSLQGTIAYSFYRLSTLAQEPVSIVGLAEKILLPPVLKEVKALPEWMKPDWIISARILQHMESFGLVKCIGDGDELDSRKGSVVKTELFDNFMWFEW